MKYDEFDIIKNNIIDQLADAEDYLDVREFTEWYEEQLELQNRPRKPDVINNVSINSPYLIDLNEYKDKWIAYESKHAESLNSFNEESRIIQFMKDRHGYLKKYPYLYDNRLFDMPFDLALYIYCVDHDWDIEFKPKIVEKGHNPDFCINGNILIVYYPKHIEEIYSINEHGYSYGPDDNRIKLPVKYYSDLIEKIGYCDSDSGTQSEYKLWVLNENSKFNEEVWQWMYDHYSDGFVPLFRMDIPFPWPNQDFRDTSPSGLIRHFHKSIYDAHYMDEPSALEVWDNKEIFKRLAINRLKYVGQCDLVTMLHGLNIAKVAVKVSVFKPTLAKSLIETYLSDAKEIFDPFSGFSGRMFGAIDCGIPYIGRDVSEIHINESKQILQFIKDNPQLKRRYPHVDKASVEVSNAITSYGSYDCLLTCPPYAVYKKGVLKNIEEWRNPNQEILTCDQWIDICIQNYKCRKYLFVVDDSIVKYRNFIVGTIGNKGHMGRNVEFIVLIDFTNYWNDRYVSTNGSYGWTPSDITENNTFKLSDGTEYVESIGEGKTPFDI